MRETEYKFDAASPTWCYHYYKGRDGYRSRKPTPAQSRIVLEMWPNSWYEEEYRGEDGMVKDRPQSLWALLRNGWLICAELVPTSLNPDDRDFDYKRTIHAVLDPPEIPLRLWRLRDPADFEN